MVGEENEYGGVSLVLCALDGTAPSLLPTHSTNERSGHILGSGLICCYIRVSFGT